MKRLTALLLLLAAFLPTVRAKAQSQPNDSLTVSLLFCSPGTEVFELYGHEAVRIHGTRNGYPIDEVINYGVFDFDTPGFIPRFVAGQTDYRCASLPTPLFLQSYRDRGSAVTEISLPLNQTQAARLYENLLLDTRPPRSTYRYKYFTANCATKPLDHVGTAWPKIQNRFGYWDDLGRNNLEYIPSYRELLHLYDKNYPWYRLGLDLVLGSSADRRLQTNYEQCFLPERQREILSEWEYTADYSTPTSDKVLESQELVKADATAVQSPTPKYLTPLFFACLLLAIVIVMLGRAGITAWFSALWFLLLAVAGLLICYLTFFSEHEGVSSNKLCLWLNPFWIFPAVLQFFVKNRRKPGQPKCPNRLLPWYSKSLLIPYTFKGILLLLVVCTFMSVPLSFGQISSSPTIGILILVTLLTAMPLLTRRIRPPFPTPAQSVPR